MRLLLDMNLPPRWADAFADHGVEAVHWSSIGEARAPDTEILSYAHAYAFIVLTHDLDFGAILASTGLRSPSVIQLRFAAQHVVEAFTAVSAALDQFADELHTGALLTVDARQARVSILPLRRQ